MIFKIFIILNIEMFILEYIWIDGNNNLRSKNKVVESIDDIPIWNFDGSSTKQSEINDSERFLKPVYTCKNPFYENGLIVLCAVYNDYKSTIPNENNIFDECLKVLEKYKDENPWFGFEQEYFLLSKNGSLLCENYEKQGQYYCSVGTNNAIGRNISDEHLKTCLEIGLKIYGTNAEVAPGQWEYQIGTLEGIEAAHQLWISRYILLRISEKHDICVSFHPKPFDFLNGSGCHANFSTKKTRNKLSLDENTEKNGLDYIINDIIPKLKENHKLYIDNYGKHNDKRLTGKYETSNISNFSWGIGTRNTSIRIGNDTNEKGFGYFEDRRPASNCDPYLVCMLLVLAI